MMDIEGKDTICALSTPPGEGGVAVIRVCGDRASSLVRQMTTSLPQELESHRIYYVHLRRPSDHSLLDDVLVSFFKKGHSYTGDETIEISCHGGRMIPQLILNELMALGARPADRGEFTFRAFMSGRLDLVQAESVLEIIQSESTLAAKRATRNLKGELSKRFAEIEDRLVWSLAHIEAGIDFVEEGLETADDQTLMKELRSLQAQVEKLIQSYRHGRALKGGFPVAIVGLPNAGKSSLLNAILGEEKAIVTDVPGTTRDVVEGTKLIEGLLFHFFDTAGIRETEDKVEKIGINRAIESIKSAEVILWVHDVTLSLNLQELPPDIRGNQSSVYLLFNKVDSLSPNELSSVKSQRQSEARSLGLNNGSFISVQAAENMKEFENFLLDFAKSSSSSEMVTVTQSRHMHLLEKISMGLVKALEQAENRSSPEFIAFELQESIRAIHEILGKEFHEQVIDRVFKEFCLGK